MGPGRPGHRAGELGIHDDWVMALAVAGDGRVISTGSDGRVLAWAPAAAGAVPKTLGRSDGRIKALEALGDGRVVSGGYAARAGVGPGGRWRRPGPERQPRRLGGDGGGTC